MSYSTAIPQAVFAQVPIWASNITASPIRVDISSFDDEDAFFAIEVDFNPRWVRPTDRRQSAYVVVERHTVYLDYEGRAVDSLHSRYHVAFTAREQPEGAPEIKEQEIEDARHADATATILATMGEH